MEHAVEIDVSERRRGDELPRSAWVFLSAVVLATLAGAVPALASGAPSGSDLFTFAVLAGGAAVAQFYLVGGGSYHGLHTAIPFVIAGALLLPPELLALMAGLQHLPHGFRHPDPPLHPPSNIARLTLPPP